MGATSATSAFVQQYTDTWQFAHATGITPVTV